ncbi:MAG: hypothetical protein GY859_32985 [Desulfobacterales bacterium]|nr:hypothetical protein [Desulfobacterales bacterium]
MTKKTNLPGEAIMDALTGDQTAPLLDVLLSEIEVSRCKKELREADAETAETMTRALDMLGDKKIELEERLVATNQRILESCRARLAENWRYGRPLVEDALEKEDYQKVESVLIRTFSSYSDAAGGPAWRPEDSLLEESEWGASESDKEELSDLLEIWSAAAERLGKSERAAALRFQGVVFRDSDNWDAVTEACRMERRRPLRQAVEPLFDQWRNLTAARSAAPEEASAVQDTWIHWLIDARLDVEKKRKGFLTKLEAWLALLMDNGSAFEEQSKWLAVLTRDLPGADALEKKHPAFYAEILSARGSGASRLSTYRRESLEMMKAGPCLSLAVKIWRGHLRRLAPDPALATKSDYTRHARWSAALRDLNPAAFDALMDQWRQRHARRRNLWRDLRAMGLGV